MRNSIVRGAVVLTLAVTGGCVGVIGNTVSVRDDVLARRAVVVDGRIYVVDVRTGGVTALEPEAIGSAGRFVPVPTESDED